MEPAMKQVRSSSYLKSCLNYTHVPPIASTILDSMSLLDVASLSMFFGLLNHRCATPEWSCMHFRWAKTLSAKLLLFQECDCLAHAMHMTLRYACSVQAGDVAPLQEFGALFDDVKFRKGLQLNFTSSKNGALITQVDNKEVLVDSSQLIASVICCI